VSRATNRLTPALVDDCESAQLVGHHYWSSS
jgi:hypothetical protein